MTLFTSLRPPAPPPDIDLRCCDAREMLASVRGARLVIADPPWRYAREAGVANPEQNGIYSGLSEAEIVALLDLAYDAAADGSRLAVWYTWPKDAEWQAAGGAGPRWGPRKSRGAWVKEPRINGGVGYHWRGWSEPVALFARGATGPVRCLVGNGYVSPTNGHSEKPVEWMRQWIEAWTDPGDLVVDLFAGLGSVARACLGTGRRYVGAELDPERYDRALCRLRMP